MRFKKMTPLSEVVTLQRGFDLPKDDRVHGSVPVIASTGIGGYHNEAKVKAPGVVIGRSGSIGGGQYIVENFWPLNTTLYVKDFKRHNPRYVYYLMKSIDFHNYNVGSGVPTLNRNHLNCILIPEIGIENEKAISRILGDLDDKIALNTQINSTLEAMAQALFKSWFVDFDPVKAKMAARAAGGDDEAVRNAAMAVMAPLPPNAPQPPKGGLMSGETQNLAQIADLFPEKMVESEIGEIPEGWGVKRIGDISDLNANSWPKKNRPDMIEYVDLANTKWGIIQSTEAHSFENAPSRARRKLMPGDTIIGTVRPGNGSYSFIQKKELTGSTGFAVLTPVKAIYAEFIYLCSTSRENIERLQHLADGGAYPAVSPEIISATECILPIEDIVQDEIVSVFHMSVEMLFHKVQNNIMENIVLNSLRDTLLPKLLSGEIDLSNSRLSEECIA